ncbi:MAG: B3/4 domain-containing protein, partial [Buchnera aphidicola]|nr:B3/4 domain-containing protein [Buchnera aphidicola]
FLGRIIKNININAITPFWMKKRLFHSDILSDNVIENIINYVLIEIGQPIQVMNADNIYDEIIIRMAENKEKITLKNEKIVSLD